MLYVELRAKKLWKFYRIIYIHVHMNSHTCMCRTCFNHIASQWNLELWLLTSRQRYCSSLELQRSCVKNWGLKSYKNCTDYCECTYMYVHRNLEYTDTEVTNAMSTVYTTLDYEYRHKNKGTGLILVPRKCWVYKWDQKSYRNKVCTSCTGLILRKGI